MANAADANDDEVLSIVTYVDIELKHIITFVTLVEFVSLMQTVPPPPIAPPIKKKVLFALGSCLARIH